MDPTPIVEVEKIDNTITPIPPLRVAVGRVVKNICDRATENCLNRKSKKKGISSKDLLEAYWSEIYSQAKVIWEDNVHRFIDMDRQERTKIKAVRKIH
jgi:hypothetical protein